MKKVPRGQVNQIRKKPTVEGGKACLYSKRSNVANKTPKTLKYPNNNHERKRSLEGVITCNQRLAIQRALPMDGCPASHTQGYVNIKTK